EESLLLAGRQVPDAELAVVPAADEALAVRREGQRPGPAAEVTQRGERLAGRDLPHLDAGRVADGDALAVGRQGQVRPVAAEPAQLPACGPVPNAHVGVGTDRDQRFAVRREGDALGGLLVAG